MVAVDHSHVLLCTQLECKTVEEMLTSMDQAKAEGANIVEFCFDSMNFTNISQVDYLINRKALPAIFSYRFKSSQGECKSNCIQVLKRALDLEAEFVEMDYEVASEMSIGEYKYNRSRSKVIVSSYVNDGKPSTEKLGDLIASMQSIGADVVKLEIAVDSINDLPPIFQMLTLCQVPLIAIAVGSRGLISQLLGPKFGGFLVYGSLGSKSVAGFPTLSSLRQVYKVENVKADTKVFGLVSNPVGHSKGPILHNHAFRHARYNGIYVPMLVDDVKEFFKTYTAADFAGFSVGIPHKEAAMACCDEVHPLAKSIGAVNTIIRRPMDGKLIGYNTDCDASISAIEDALRERQVCKGVASDTSPLAGKIFVLVGAGGAGRALAFGAKNKGARVVIFNRNYERAQALAHAVSGEALPYECLHKFCPKNGMIFANASAIGMEPNSNESPLPKDALKAYELVFDAVYTPRNTRLLQEAKEVGACVVSGIEMFIRQALGQFRLFTGGLAPEVYMRNLVLEQF